MNSILALLFVLLPVSSFAQNKQLPIRFVGDLILANSRADQNPPTPFDDKVRATYDLETNKLIDASLVEALAGKRYVAFIEMQRSAEAIFQRVEYRNASNVVAKGDVWGQLISVEQIQEKMTAIALWEIRVRVGEEEIYLLTSVERDQVLLDQPIGDGPARIVLARPLATQIRKAILAQNLSQYAVTIDLVPVEWKELSPPFTATIDLTPGIRGNFTYTHTRLPTYMAISLDRARTQTALGLPKRGLAMACWQRLAGE